MPSHSATTITFDAIETAFQRGIKSDQRIKIQPQQQQFSNPSIKNFQQNYFQQNYQRNQQFFKFQQQQRFFTNSIYFAENEKLDHEDGNNDVAEHVENVFFNDFA